MTATSDARTWLKANGYRIKDKGRIPADLLAIYQAKVVKKRGRNTVRLSDSGTDSASDSASLFEDSVERDEGAKKKKVVKRTSCGFCTVIAAHRHVYCPGHI